jgi:hypothetical protein
MPRIQTQGVSLEPHHHMRATSGTSAQSWTVMTAMRMHMGTITRAHHGRSFRSWTRACAKEAAPANPGGQNGQRTSAVEGV